MRPRILAFAGSTRAQSFNKNLIAIACEGARRWGADVTLIDLRDYPLPLFDEDIEKSSGLPGAGVKLKELFRGHHALMISSPEYNSSVSAVLKNTIDWVSRPEPGQAPLSCFANKVGVLMAASPGALGGLRGLVHLRAILGNIQVTLLPDQVAVARAHEAFDASGRLKDAAQQASIEKLGEKLAATTARLIAS